MSCMRGLLRAPGCEAMGRDRRGAAGGRALPRPRSRLRLSCSAGEWWMLHDRGGCVRRPASAGKGEGEGGGAAHLCVLACVRACARVHAPRSEWLVHAWGAPHSSERGGSGSRSSRAHAYPCTAAALRICVRDVPEMVARGHWRAHNARPSHMPAPCPCVGPPCRPRHVRGRCLAAGERRALPGRVR